MQLTGGPQSPPPADRNVYGELVSQGKADVFITDCTNSAAAMKEQPALRVVAVPDAINVRADYGLALMEGARPDGARFVEHLISAAGQRRLAEFGFSPPS